MGKGKVGNIGKISREAISKMIADSTPKVSQEAGDSSSAMIHKSGTSGDSGLAASAVDTTPQPTLTSGIQNPVANSAMFGNRANGSGMMEGLAGSGLRNRIQNNQGMQNQYGIIGGAILI